MRSRISPLWAVVGGSAALLAALVGLLVAVGGRRGVLVVQCAASQRPPLEDVVRDYERDTGVPVTLRFGGSQSLLSDILLTGDGDVFLPADDSYLETARGHGLVAEVFPLCRMTAVVAVPAGNPKRLATWADLLRPEVTVAQAEPDVAAIGKLTRDRLQAAGRWDELRRRTTVFKGTVTDVANAVALKTVDAGIVWDVIPRANPALAAVELPELAGVQAHVSAATLTGSRRPAEARRFARYLAGPGRERFRAHGYAPPPGGGPK